MKAATKLAAGCLAGLAALSVVPAASAAVVAGSLSASDPTYNRSLPGCGALSAVGTAVHYDVFNLSVSATGGLDLSLASAFDNFLTIYSGAFNPASALTNCYAADDDSGANLQAAFDNLVLNSAVSYFAVVSSFNNGDTGDYTLNVVLDQANTTGAEISLGVPGQVPEPATLALLGLGVAGLGFSRRKQ